MDTTSLTSTSSSPRPFSLKNILFSPAQLSASLSQGRDLASRCVVAILATARYRSVISDAMQRVCDVANHYIFNLAFSRCNGGDESTHQSISLHDRIAMKITYGVHYAQEHLHDLAALIQQLPLTIDFGDGALLAQSLPQLSCETRDKLFPPNLEICVGEEMCLMNRGIVASIFPCLMDHYDSEASAPLSLDGTHLTVDILQHVVSAYLEHGRFVLEPCDDAWICGLIELATVSGNTDLAHCVDALAASRCSPELPNISWICGYAYTRCSNGIYLPQLHEKVCQLANDFEGIELVESETSHTVAVGSIEILDDNTCKILSVLIQCASSVRINDETALQRLSPYWDDGMNHVIKHLSIVVQHDQAFVLETLKRKFGPQSHFSVERDPDGIILWCWKRTDEPLWNLDMPRCLELIARDPSLARVKQSSYKGGEAYSLVYNDPSKTSAPLEETLACLQTSDVTYLDINRILDKHDIQALRRFTALQHLTAQIQSKSGLKALVELTEALGTLTVIWIVSLLNSFPVTYWNEAIAKLRNVEDLTIEVPAAQFKQGGWDIKAPNSPIETLSLISSDGVAVGRRGLNAFKFNLPFLKTLDLEEINTKLTGKLIQKLMNALPKLAFLRVAKLHEALDLYVFLFRSRKRHPQLHIELPNKFIGWQQRHPEGEKQHPTTKVWSYAYCPSETCRPHPTDTVDIAEEQAQPSQAASQQLALPNGDLCSIESVASELLGMLPKWGWNPHSEATTHCYYGLVAQCLFDEIMNTPMASRGDPKIWLKATIAFLLRKCDARNLQLLSDLLSQLESDDKGPNIATIGSILREALVPSMSTQQTLELLADTPVTCRDGETTLVSRYLIALAGTVMTHAINTLPHRQSMDFKHYTKDVFSIAYHGLVFGNEGCDIASVATEDLVALMELWELWNAEGTLTYCLTRCDQELALRTDRLNLNSEQDRRVFGCLLHFVRGNHADFPAFTMRSCIGQINSMYRRVGFSIHNHGPKAVSSAGQNYAIDIINPECLSDSDAFHCFEWILPQACELRFINEEHLLWLVNHIDQSSLPPTMDLSLTMELLPSCDVLTAILRTLTEKGANVRSLKWSHESVRLTIGFSDDGTTQNEHLTQLLTASQLANIMYTIHLEHYSNDQAAHQLYVKNGLLEIRINSGHSLVVLNALARNYCGPINVSQGASIKMNTALGTPVNSCNELLFSDVRRLTAVSQLSHLVSLKTYVAMNNCRQLRKGFSQVAEGCPQLSSLNVVLHENLERRHVQHGDGVCPSIGCLNVLGDVKEVKLQCEDPRSAEVMSTLVTQAVRWTSLMVVSNFCGLSPDKLSSIIQHCQHLDSMGISISQSDLRNPYTHSGIDKTARNVIGDEHISRIVEHLPNLKQLSLNTTLYNHISGVGLHQIARIKGLESLVTSVNVSWTDTDLANIAALSQLKTLHLQGNLNLCTGRGLANVISHLDKLTDIHLPKVKFADSDERRLLANACAEVESVNLGNLKSDTQFQQALSIAQDSSRRARRLGEKSRLKREAHIAKKKKADEDDISI